MVLPLVLAVLLVLAAVLGARYAGTGPAESASPSPEPSATVSESPAAAASPTPSLPPHALVGEYYLADYMHAVKTGKLVVLYFYANWCPVCKEEFPKFQTAIAGLSEPRVAAFRVNYNDSDTDDDEKTAAKTFQVGSQHTLVIVKDGKEAYQSSAPVDYLSVIREHLR
jgi:thiol-disulfide isomerase/thioredoxin